MIEREVRGVRRGGRPDDADAAKCISGTAEARVSMSQPQHAICAVASGVCKRNIGVWGLGARFR